MQIALYRETNPLSMLIRTLTRGPYSHAAIITGEDQVMEVAVKGVYYSTLKSYHKSGVLVDIFEVDTTPEQETKIRAFLEAQLGKGYDYRMLFAFVMFWGNNKTSLNRWFCSELVFAAFKEAEINLLERVEPWKVYPTMLSYSPLLNKTKTIVLK